MKKSIVLFSAVTSILFSNNFAMAECYTKFDIPLREQSDADSVIIGDLAEGTKLNISKVDKYHWEYVENGWVWITDSNTICDAEREKVKQLELANKAKADRLKAAAKEGAKKAALERKKFKAELENSLLKDGTGDWKIEQFVDSFGDATNNKYVGISAIGRFKDSATTDGVCYVDLIITKEENTGIFLHKYSRNNGAEYFIGRSGFMKAKNSSGKVVRINRLSKWGVSGGVSTGDPDLIDFLKKSVGIVKIAITDGYTSVYYFKINANGFSKKFAQIDK